MIKSSNQLEAAKHRLAAVLNRSAGDEVTVMDVAALSGGTASLSYAVDAVRAGKAWPLVLQVNSSADDAPRGMSRAIQAALQERARAAGVRAAPVVAVLTPQDSLGDGFIMEFVAGETLAPRWLRDPVYGGARAAMVKDCGEALARIHAIDPAALLDLNLPVLPAEAQLRQLRDLYDSLEGCVPIFELAFQELAGRLSQSTRRTLVHGDFRSGNFIVGEDGLRAVLDWELAHIGDPYMDIGWLCTNTWRFGEYAKPAGGFGARAELYKAYEDAGGMRIDPETALAFEMLGSLRWGVMCMQMAASHLAGDVASVERAAIGRRVSETEADLLYMLKYGAL